MASKEKFVEPMKKSYSVKQLLNGDSLQEALHGIRNIQTMLWETMPDGRRCRMNTMNRSKDTSTWRSRQ